MSVDAAGLDCPYVGLDPYEAAHANYFFGRTIDSAVIAENVLVRRITVLYGASGVGKSSVLNVGLPKALREFAAAAQTISRREWHDPGVLCAWLDTAIGYPQAKSAKTLIIILDQFEEYFLYPDAEQVKAFAKSLAAVIARTDIEVHLLFALRDDGLHRLDALRPILPGLLETTLELRHLDEPAVREAIKQPIVEWNKIHEPRVVIDDDFVETLLGQLRPKDNAGQPIEGGRIELAYLQLALLRIWEAEGGINAKALRTSTLTERLKGVTEIARRHVEEVLGKLSGEDQAICATVFDRLVTYSGGKILYSTADLAPVAKVEGKRLDEVLKPLASGKYRLLRRVEMPGTGGAHGYEILHDVLARPILIWKEAWAAKQETKVERARAEAVRENQQREIDEERKRNKTLRLVCALAIIFGVVAGVNYVLEQKASAIVSITEESYSNPTAAAAALKELISRWPSDPAWLRLILRLDESPMYRVSLAHNDRVVMANFASDGSLVTASDDKIAYLWDRKGNRLRELTGHTKPIAFVGFSPDSKNILTTSGDNTARLWDRDGNPVRELTGHSGPVRTGAFSPDSTLIVTASDDSTARLWDVHGNFLRELKGHKFAVRYAAFSRDSQLFATGSDDGSVLLWDRQGNVVPLPGSEDRPGIQQTSGGSGGTLLIPVTGIALNQDGRIVVAAYGDGTARIWDRRTSGTRIAAVDAASAASTPVAATSVALDPTGEVILVTYVDGIARLWDVKGRSLVQLKGHGLAVRFATFNRDGDTVVTASDDGTARLWDLEGKLLAELVGHTGAVGYAAFSEDGQTVATVSDDNTARLWNRHGTPLSEFSLKTGPVPLNFATLSPDEKVILTISRDGTEALWDHDGKVIAPLKVTGMLKGSSAPFSKVSFRSDGQVFAITYADGTLRLWNPQGNQLPGLSVAPKAASTRALVKKPTDAAPPQLIGLSRLTPSKPLAVFSPYDNSIVTTSLDDNVARVWDDLGAQPKELSGHQDGIVFVAFSKDGRIATASYDGTARVWDKGGNKVFVTEKDSGSVAGSVLNSVNAVVRVALSPDGEVLATTSYDNTARLWDKQGKLIKKLEGQPGEVDFSHDGQTVITVLDNGTARVWNTQGNLVAPLEPGSTAKAYFSVNDELILTTSRDNTARLWDRRGKLLAKFNMLRGGSSYGSSITDANFSQNGKEIVAVLADGTVRRWPIDADLFAEHVSRVAVPCLTTKERQFFFFHKPSWSIAGDKETCTLTQRSVH